MSQPIDVEPEGSTTQNLPSAPPVVAMVSGGVPAPGPNSGPGVRSQGHLQAVPDIELQMGDLPSELAAQLGDCQAVIDVARAGAHTADGAPLELTWEDGRCLVPDGYVGAVLWSPVTTASSEVVVVEGATNTLAATAFAADDVVVAGAVEGFGATDWTTLAPLVSGRPVTLIPDKDLTQDWQTFDAIDRAINSLEIVGASDVRIAINSTGKGLVELLTSTAEPTSVLANLLSNATAFRKNMRPSGRRPARAMATYEDGDQNLGDFVSPRLGQIVQISPPQYTEREGKQVLVSKPEHLAGQVDGRDVFATKTLMEAAVTVIAATEVLDDLAYPPSPPQMRYQLDVQVGAGDGAGHYPLDVDDADLAKPTVWRPRLGAAGAAVTIEQAGMGPIGGQRIGEAIRRTISPSTQVNHRILRTGWFTASDGVARWCDRTGGHGPDEKTSSVAADLRTITAGVDIPGADFYSLREIQESVREVIRAADQFVDPTMWIAGVAATYRAVSGADREAVLWVHGKHGAGKSFTVSVLASALGPPFGPGREPPPPDATLASFRTMAYEAHEVPLFFDDARPLAERMGGGDQMVALDTSVRVGYADSAQIKAKLESSGSGQWHAAPIRRTRPFMIITGEDPPPAHDPGTVERCLVLRVEHDTSLIRGAKEALETLCERRAFQPALAGYLRRRAQMITDEHGGDLETARRAITHDTKDLVAPWIEARPKMAGLGSRVRGTAHTFCGGAVTFLNWAADCRAITFDERDRLVQEWVGCLLDAVEASASTYLQGATVADQILDAVKDNIASGKYCIGTGSQNATVIGQIVSVGGQQHVALLPAVVEKIAREIGLTGNISIPSKMSDVVVPTTNKKGAVERTTRQVRMGGAKIWTYVIRTEKMSPGEYDTSKAVQDDPSEPEPEQEPEPEVPTAAQKPRRSAQVPTRQAKAKVRKVPA